VIGEIPNKYVKASMRDIPQISEDDDCLKHEEDGKEIVM